MTITRATPADLPALLALMQAFYTEERLTFRAEVERAVTEIVAGATLDAAYLIGNDGGVNGYFVLTFGFSVERGGKTALLDELYVIPKSRAQGLGKAAIAEAITIAKSAGCRTLHLEVDRANLRARTFYEHAGFMELPRGYLTRNL
jgi:GNAT superfamily N-acetyltransferase